MHIKQLNIQYSFSFLLSMLLFKIAYSFIRLCYFIKKPKYVVPVYDGANGEVLEIDFKNKRWRIVSPTVRDFVDYENRDYSEFITNYWYINFYSKNDAIKFSKGIYKNDYKR